MALDVYKDWLGIPEGPRPPDHYALLRLVQFEDDIEKVRKNYKKLNSHVRKYATGQYSAQSQDLLNELAKAMLCLTDVDWKKEYDQSLGRAVADVDEETGLRPLTAYLQDDGLITAAQAKEVQTYCDKTGLSLRDAVIQRKLATQEQAARALAASLGRPYLDLTDVLPDDSVLDQLPRSVVRRHVCLPLFIEDDALLITCADEPEHELEDEVRLRFGLPMRVVISTVLAINQGIAKYYAAGLRSESTETPVKGKSSVKNSAPKPKAKLSEAELLERRNLGIVIINMIIIVLGNLDAWVLWPRVWRLFLPGFVGFFPLVGTIVIGLPICYFIFLEYIKPSMK